MKPLTGKPLREIPAGEGLVGNNDGKVTKGKANKNNGQWSMQTWNRGTVQLLALRPFRRRLQVMHCTA